MDTNITLDNENNNIFGVVIGLFRNNFQSSTTLCTKFCCFFVFKTTIVTFHFHQLKIEYDSIFDTSYILKLIIEPNGQKDIKEVCNIITSNL